MYYVSMTDTFMSGWGPAKSKTNKLIIVCETREQAERIERNANERSEMKTVNVTQSKPQYGPGYYVSWKDYAELGNIWTKD
jgi:hypothetical protein